MEAETTTSTAVRALIEQTYAAMSTPDGDVGVLFGHEDIAVSGSGQGELFYGPDHVTQVARMIASQGMPWVPEQVRVWQRGDVAWAQILGHVETVEDGQRQRVPYWTTGVFGRDVDGWQWLYWGGAEPQESPRV